MSCEDEAGFSVPQNNCRAVPVCVDLFRTNRLLLVTLLFYSDFEVSLTGTPGEIYKEEVDF